MRRLFVVVAVMGYAYCAPASAVNKCTGTDGRVSYQEAPCKDAARAEKIEAPGAPARAGEVWQFSREKDEMTGKTTCFAYSPAAYISWGFGSRNSTAINLQLAVRTGFQGMVLSVRSTAGGPVFHNDVSGSGLKVDGQEFVGLVTKYNPHALGVGDEQGGALIGTLQKGKTFRVRVRMWPYAELLDTSPISLAGYERSVKRAMGCASE